jgi:hypothetical protein
MESNKLPASARIARQVLKVIALPLIVLAVLVRFTIPPATWWIDYTFLGLLLFAVLLAAIGRVSWRKAEPGDSQNRPSSN